MHQPRIVVALDKSAGYYFESFVQRAADLVFASLPRPRPSREALLNCKIVSHRGEHDNRKVLENTHEAFAAAAAGDVWGIEFDVRWTRDYIPVVIHDVNSRRVFGVDLDIAANDFNTLRQRLPQVPSLSETVSRYCGTMHLMIELKADKLTDVGRKREQLKKILGGLEPARDYHVLALQLDQFEAVDFCGDRACIPVAEFNMGMMSRAARARQFAGISGHYILLHKALIRHHARHGQRVGSGFIASRYCFYRELNRGVDWIFSNRAARLGALRRQLLG